jgi:hypothetical protein
MATTTNDTTQVFRPSFEQYKKWLGKNLARRLGAVASFIVIILIINGAPLYIWIPILFVVGILTFLVVKWMTNNHKARIVIDGSKIVHYNAFGLKKVLPLSDSLDGILTHYIQGSGPYGISSSYDMLLIRDKKTGKRFKLLDAFWKPEDLRAIAKYAEVEIPYANDLAGKASSQLDTLSPVEIESRHPGLMRSSDLHPVRFIVLGSVIGTIAVFGVILLTVWIHDGGFISSPDPSSSEIQTDATNIAADNLAIAKSDVALFSGDISIINSDITEKNITYLKTDCANIEENINTAKSDQDFVPDAKTVGYKLVVADAVQMMQNCTSAAKNFNTNTVAVLKTDMSTLTKDINAY